MKKQKSCRNRCPDGSRYTPMRVKKPGLLDAFREIREELTGPSFQFHGGDTLDIDECTAILACDSDMVRLELRETVLTILGSGLVASDFSAYTLTVRGNIRSIELEPLSGRRKEERR